MPGEEIPPVPSPVVKEDDSKKSFFAKSKGLVQSASDAVVFKSSQGLLALQKGLSTTTGMPSHLTYQRNFNLPTTEVPIAEWTCRIVSEKSDYIRGVLTVSTNFLCFQAGAPFDTYRLCIPMGEIVDVSHTTQKTIMVATFKAFTMEFGEFASIKGVMQQIWTAWKTFEAIHADEPAPAPTEPAKTEPEEEVHEEEIEAEKDSGNE